MSSVYGRRGRYHHWTGLGDGNVLRSFPKADEEEEQQEDDDEMESPNSSSSGDAGLQARRHNIRRHHRPHSTTQPQQPPPLPDDPDASKKSYDAYHHAFALSSDVSAHSLRQHQQRHPGIGMVSGSVGGVPGAPYRMSSSSPHRASEPVLLDDVVTGQMEDAAATAAPWQFSAFLILGAVILISALFLHVLVDTTTAEYRYYYQQQQQGSNATASSRKHRRTTSKGKKMKDDYYYDSAADYHHKNTTTTTTTTATTPSYYYHPPSHQHPRQRKVVNSHSAATATTSTPSANTATTTSASTSSTPNTNSNNYNPPTASTAMTTPATTSNNNNSCHASPKPSQQFLHHPLQHATNLQPAMTHAGSHAHRYFLQQSPPYRSAAPVVASTTSSTISSTTSKNRTGGSLSGRSAKTSTLAPASPLRTPLLLRGASLSGSLVAAAAAKTHNNNNNTNRPPSVATALLTPTTTTPAATNPTTTQAATASTNNNACRASLGRPISKISSHASSLDSLDSLEPPSAVTPTAENKTPAVELPSPSVKNGSCAANLPLLPPPPPEWDDDSDDEHFYHYSREISVDDTPRVRNGRKVVEAQVTMEKVPFSNPRAKPTLATEETRLLDKKKTTQPQEMLVPSATPQDLSSLSLETEDPDEPSCMPFLPTLDLDHGDSSGEFGKQAGGHLVPAQPRSMNLNELQLHHMEIGESSSSLVPSSDPLSDLDISEDRDDKTISKKEEEEWCVPTLMAKPEDKPFEIDFSEVSEVGDVDEPDHPRGNIEHVRESLLEWTNSCASLQAAIQFSELTLLEVIGGGGFGQVWRATWRSTPVAVKVLTGSAQRRDVPRPILEEFAAEINLLRGMRHPNICLYMGACLDPPNRAIITELAANGSLWDALRLPLNPPFQPCDGATRNGWSLILYEPDPKHGTPPSITAVSMTPTGRRKRLLAPPLAPAKAWPWPLVKRVACGTARGMAYLHSGKPPVLHRDLKSANILLDESYVPKVCDFGLSRLKAQDSMTGNCGTVQWMAPEVLASHGYNEKADVFSFGIICWELLTRQCPYEGMSAIECALAVLNRNHRPEIPKWCPPALQALIRACVKKEPAARPTFPEILEALDAMP